MAGRADRPGTPASLLIAQHMPALFTRAFAERLERAWGQSVTEALLAGTLDALARHGVADDAIDVATVPGAFELPLCAQRLASVRFATPSFR